MKGKTSPSACFVYGFITETLIFFLNLGTLKKNKSFTVITLLPPNMIQKSKICQYQNYSEDPWSQVFWIRSSALNVSDFHNNTLQYIFSFCSPLWQGYQATGNAVGGVQGQEVEDGIVGSETAKHLWLAYMVKGSKKYFLHMLEKMHTCQTYWI